MTTFNFRTVKGIGGMFWSDEDITAKNAIRKIIEDNKLNVNPDKASLILCGKAIPDDDYLNKYNLQNYAVLHIVEIKKKNIIDDDDKIILTV